MNTVRVGLDVPLARTFDYRHDPAEDVRVGDRVLVPFGKRRAVGVVLEVNAPPRIDPSRVRSIAGVLRDAPPLSPEDLRLLRFAADYYHHPLGQVVLNALPQRLKRTARAVVEETQYEITEAGLTVQVDALPPQAHVRRKVLAALQAQRVLTRAELASLAPSAPEAAKELIARGWASLCAPPAGDRPRALQVARESRTLTAAQERAAAAIVTHLGHFQVLLLAGVTGSGKTEVYLRAAEAVLASGGQVLMLVPEIALTPQLENMVRSRFPDTPLATLHSGLNETERSRNWLAAQAGAVRLLLGTRLAVFAPLPELALIVVDEEHDSSFKQTEGFCYSARDMAVVRASQRGVPVVLGSATPALESYHNAVSGRYELLELSERINGRPPRIECISLQGARAHGALAPRLLEAIAGCLARREQSLIFINRRGYAPVLMCHSCGWLSDCHRCSAQLVLHLATRALHCHHCGHQAPVPHACPSCGNPELSPVGQGTQRVEETIKRAFPDARVLRIDRDTTRRKHAWEHMRERIQAREVDILVGTQMLAKGHDFPHLALVGVLNADSMLYSADFRASERLYALLTQVSGRAGRGDAQGEVLIQTEFPQHPIYQALRDQDMHRYARQLLAERGASGFPPYVHQALLRAEAAQLETALEFLEDAKRIGAQIGGAVELFDAVPAAMVRLAGRERGQLLVQAAARPALHEFLSAWCLRLSDRKATPARWTLEVDPLEL